MRLHKPVSRVLRRNRKTVGLVYGKADPQGNPEVEDYTYNGSTGFVEQDPVTGQPLMLHTSSDIACLYVYDGTGSPAFLLTEFETTSFQYAYDPYGLPTTVQDSGGNGTKQNPYLFKGGIQDRGSLLVKFGQRWYNPVTGTWTQQDTLDSPLDPANANRYAYAGDDPINAEDPSGQSVGACLGALGGFYGIRAGWLQGVLG